MGNRRMFSQKIINTARFLKMPVSSRLLYFHLGLQADDDGVVEAYNVLRMSGLSEDDLKILIAKGFVILLNEDLVSFITDWREHNSIRADRKVDSIYKDLLLKIVPDVELINKRPRADSQKLIGQPMDVQRTQNGQPKGGLSKDKLSKDKLSKDNKYMSDSNEYRLASYLFNFIKRNNDQAKEPNFQKWAQQFNYILRIDKRGIEDVKRVIKFSQDDSFWYKNILSPDKLRKHFDKLILQANDLHKVKNSKKIDTSAIDNF